MPKFLRVRFPDGDWDIPAEVVAKDYVVHAIDCRNHREVPEVSGTLQAKESGSYSLNYQNPIRIGYTVRRLTPTEAERLQGLPDGWTAWGINEHGKRVEGSDTARYRALGNGLAMPPTEFVMRRIVEVLTTD